MKKKFREQPLPHRAGLFHNFRPTPLAFALFWLFPTASQGAQNLPPLQIDPGLMQPAAGAAKELPVKPATQASPAKTPPAESRPPRSDRLEAGAAAGTLPATRAAANGAETGAPLPLKSSRSLTLNPPPGTPSTPVFISGMRIQGHHDIETEVIGEAELRQWGQVISADRLRYNKPEDEVFAQGNVRIEQKGDITEGPELKLTMEKKEGYLQQPVFQLTQQKPAGRGDAKMLLFEGENKYRLEDARYTTCQAGSDDWYLHARNLDIDRTTQVGTANHAYIDFMGVPILYTPWMNFSLNSERKSGFLSPSFGSTINSGSEFSLPYYWNIAPNRDATITPRFMTKRGLQLKNELRYLDPKYAGIANLEVLPNDQVANLDRSFVSLKHNHNLGSGWTGALTLERVSDDNYFRDLSTNVGATSQINLLRDGLLTHTGAYEGANWIFSARSQSYQTLQDPLGAPIATPYRRTQMLLNGARVVNWSGNNLGPGAILALNSELVNFSHPSLPNAKRVTLYPSVSLPVTPLYGYITPKIGLHSTSYSFDNSTTTQQDVHRVLPIFSVDSGLYFERDINLFGSNYQQTLEPRLFYVRTPYREQTHQVFDSGDIGFGIPQIFSENRFAGVDRISDANQVTMGVTSRFFEETGIERLRGTLAQRYYLSLPQVTLPRGTPPVRKYSDLLASVGGRITNALTLDSLWQYDPELKQTGNFSLTGRYLPKPGNILNVSYRYTPVAPLVVGIKQIDTSAQWPLHGRWNGLARWNHSILDRKNLDTLAGLEYNAGCWAFRAVIHSFATATSQRSDSIFFQLELNGIGTIGSNPLDALTRNIYGYTQTTKIPNENNLTEPR